MEVSSDQHGIGPVREGKGQAVDHLVFGGVEPQWVFGEDASLSANASSFDCIKLFWSFIYWSLSGSSALP